MNITKSLTLKLMVLGTVTLSACGDPILDRIQGSWELTQSTCDSPIEAFTIEGGVMTDSEGAERCVYGSRVFNTVECLVGPFELSDDVLGSIKTQSKRSLTITEADCVSTYEAQQNQGE